LLKPTAAPSAGGAAVAEGTGTEVAPPVGMAVMEDLLEEMAELNEETADEMADDSAGGEPLEGTGVTSLDGTGAPTGPEVEGAPAGGASEDGTAGTASEDGMTGTTSEDGTGTKTEVTPVEPGRVTGRVDGTPVGRQ